MASSLIYMFLFFFTVFVLYRLYQSTRPTTKNLPPSPPKLPIIGNLHQFGSLLHHSLFQLSRRYGTDLMLIHMGSVPTLVVSSAQAAREIMQTHDVIFSNKPHRERFDILFYGSKELIVAPYGEHWRQTRKLLVQNFLTSTKLHTYSTIRDQEIKDFLLKIKDLSQRNKAVNFSSMLLEYAESITAMTTFGKKLSWDNGFKVFKDVSLAINRFYFEDINPQLAWMDRISGATAKVKAVSKYIDEFLESAISERLAGKGDHDVVEGVKPFIDELLSTQKVERDVVKVLLVDTYIAGVDTSLALMIWVMTELLANPSILKKLQEEVRTIVNGKNQITDDDVRQMKYLKAVIMESTRLHPPGPFLAPRMAAEDVKVMGYDIEKGTNVMISAWAIGRDPTVWDKPDEFMPERFINGTSSSLDFVNHNFQLLAFGAGRRNCPGRGFAMAMDEMLLANVLYNFNLTLPHDVIIDDGTYMEEVLIGTVHKKTPLLALAKPFIP